MNNENNNLMNKGVPSIFQKVAKGPIQNITSFWERLHHLLTIDLSHFSNENDMLKIIFEILLGKNIHALPEVKGERCRFKKFD